jgi:hypothetical protein
MKDEYGVDTTIEPLSYSIARYGLFVSSVPSAAFSIVKKKKLYLCKSLPPT